MDWYFSFNPILRGVVLGGLGFLAIEMVKPSFAFAEIQTGEGDAFVPRPFGSSNTADYGDQLVGGTMLPYWSIPLLLFVIFGLFV